MKDSRSLGFQGSREMLRNYKELKALIKSLVNSPMNPCPLALLYPFIGGKSFNDFF